MDSSENINFERKVRALIPNCDIVTNSCLNLRYSLEGLNGGVALTVGG